jgi:hypothetical protein
MMPDMARADVHCKLQTIAELNLNSRPKNKRQSRISRLHRIRAGTTPAAIVQTGDIR